MNLHFGEWLYGKTSPRWRLYFATVLAWLIATLFMFVAIAAHVNWAAPLVLIIGLLAAVASIVLDCADCPICGKRFSGPPIVPMGRGHTFRTKCAYCNASLSAIPKA